MKKTFVDKQKTHLFVIHRFAAGVQTQILWIASCAKHAEKLLAGGAITAHTPGALWKTCVTSVTPNKRARAASKTRVITRTFILPTASASRRKCACRAVFARVSVK